MRRLLAEAVPGDGVLGEERPERRGTSGRRWLVDPISGTADLVAGRPTYSVDLVPQDALAVSVMPALDITMAAGRGIGRRVFRGDQEEVARVSSADTLEGARVCLHGRRKPVLEQCVVADGSTSVLDLVTGRVDAVIAAGAGLDEFDLACLPALVQEAADAWRCSGRTSCWPPTVSCTTPSSRCSSRVLVSNQAPRAHEAWGIAGSRALE